MKAVILAGGEGVRLRPLSLGYPKPMTPFLDKPLLEHLINLLKKHGITDISVTLGHMPQTVTDYFGDGDQWGVHLTYFTEETPLGTAGGVKACMSHLGEEDFLVVSGDLVCDLDLSALLGFHQTCRSVATLSLCRHSAPLDYGLVCTDERGQITRFVEKPAWGEMLTNQVNTGIYVLTRRAMEQVPDHTPFDFARDLFPLLLSQGEPLYGTMPEGYWQDVGDCSAYLRCVADALSGKVELDLYAPKAAPGVWSVPLIPQGVELVPPCYIGPGVTIGAGSLIGPHVALGAGSTVGARALIQNSVLHAAKVADGATLYGAILCRGASVERGAVLNEGVVLGEEAAVGRDAILLEGVRLWRGRAAPAMARLAAHMAGGIAPTPLQFGDGGVLRGSLNGDITPELLLLLGNVLGREGQVALGGGGGAGATMLARAANSGITASGGRVVAHDAPTASAAAWLGARYDLPLSLFVEQGGDRAYLHLTGRDGLPLSRARQRKIESALLRAEMTRMPAARVGRVEPLAGVETAYASAAARGAYYGRRGLGHLTVTVSGKTPADAALTRALKMLGCEVLRAPSLRVPALAVHHGGAHLSATDETGNPLPPERLLALAVLLELERGERRLAVPPCAPAMLDTLAQAHGAVLLRLGRDGEEAATRYAVLPTLRDALFAATLLCAHMMERGETLRALNERLPAFSLARRELPLTGSRGALMQAISAAEPESERVGEGLRLRVGESWVYLIPFARRPSLRVMAEAFRAETAAELCNFYLDKAQRLDKGTATP